MTPVSTQARVIQREWTAEPFKSDFMWMPRRRAGSRSPVAWLTACWAGRAVFLTALPHAFFPKPHAHWSGHPGPGQTGHCECCVLPESSSQAEQSPTPLSAHPFPLGAVPSATSTLDPRHAIPRHCVGVQKEPQHFHCLSST